MGFPLADIVVESILRDGFNDVRRDPEILEDVFAPLTQAYASRKYGTEEIAKLQKIIEDREISLVHAYHMVDAKVPCISIQLASDKEDIPLASLQNRSSSRDVMFTDPDQLAGLVLVSDITPSAYDPVTGVVSFADSVNLSTVTVNKLFVDAAGTEHVILGGIDNTIGQQAVSISPGATVDLGAGATINSSIDFDRYSTKRTMEVFEVVLGIHTKEPLLTKYLYVLIKYFMLSRMDDLCNRGIILGSYYGSDFTRNMQYSADAVYNRFFHFTGKIEPQWRQDKVQLIDHVQVNVEVPRDKFGNEILGLGGQSVTVTEED